MGAMPRERSKKVPKIRMWGLPSTRKVSSQTIESKKNKTKKRAVRKEQLFKELKEEKQ
jgi:hypothetical protein